MVEVMLVLFAPLLLVALCRLVFLLGSHALGFGLRHRVLARRPRPVGYDSPGDEKWDGDRDEDQDGEHEGSLLRFVRKQAFCHM
jgi:hypothetical protein